MWALVAAVLVISVASSTSAQRTEARERLAKFTNRFLGAHGDGMGSPHFRYHCTRLTHADFMRPVAWT